MSRVAASAGAPGPVTPPANVDASTSLPIRFAEIRSPVRGGLKAMALTMAIVGGAAPLIIVAANVVATPDGLLRALANPVGILQFAAGAALWVALTLVIRPALREAGLSRRITVDTDLVTIEERGLAGAGRREVALAGYIGLAHRTRTTFAETAQELVLANRNPHDDVVVRRAISIGAIEAGAVARAIGVPVIEARALIGSRAPRVGATAGATVA